MLQRLLILAIFAFVGILVLDVSMSAQPAAKGALEDLANKARGVDRWMTDEFKRMAEDLQRQDVEWQKNRLWIDGIVKEGDNKFSAAAVSLEASVLDYETEQPQNPIKRRLYIENLYRLGSLYAEMCEYDNAEQRVKHGWREQQAMDGAWEGTLGYRIRGSLTVAAVLHKCDKPHEAAAQVEISMKLCAQLPKNLYNHQQNDLLAACLLAAAEIANSTGQHKKADEIAERAIAMLKATGSKRHPDVAAALHCQSVALIQLDRTGEASGKMQEAHAILKDFYDKGHPTLAAASRTIAHLEFLTGHETKAVQAVESSLAEYRRLFPEDKYPRGHPGLFQAMTALGDLLTQNKHAKESLAFHDQAWRKCQQFYPHAHVNKLTAVLSYARSLRAVGELRDALDRSKEAEAIARELDAKTEKREGANVATCLVERGLVEAQLGDHVQALATLGRSLELFAKLAPEGNPQVAIASHAEGAIYGKQGDLPRARAAFRRAMAVDQEALVRFAGVAAEAEAMSFRGTRSQSYHAYLSVGADPDDGDSYDPVWAAKSTVTRVLQKRRAAIRLAQEKSPKLRQDQDRLIDVRTQLGQLVHSRREVGSLRDEQVGQLEKEKEGLERTLAKKVPLLVRIAELDQNRPRELAARLPAGSVFVDLVAYEKVQGTETPQHHYAAFVMAPGQAARRVDLGPARPINRAVLEWRRSITNWHRLARPSQQEEWRRFGDEQAGEIHRRVWAPIAHCFPPRTRLVYVAPDGDLARFSFAALPGERRGAILLEELIIAQVPHGPFLLDQLLHPEESADQTGPFLAVGGVMSESGLLPGTQEEIRIALQIAGTRDTQTLQASSATSKAVRDALPFARFAHLATHGYFDEEKLAAEHEKVARFLRTWRSQGESAPPSPTLGLGRRSPLSYTGLELAGTSLPKGTVGDDGILSGETIAELPLDKLRLVVLSACDTGLGESTGGEGVQGLQRAFHLAGCPNVVATLWPVDDSATQILMAEFYKQLWEHQKSPLEAMCLAQRKLYRDPQLATAQGGPAHAKFWAAFVYSGSGLPFSVSPTDPRFGSVAGAPSSPLANVWTIGGVAALGAVAAAAWYWWRRRPLPMATIIGPADEAMETGRA